MSRRIVIVAACVVAGVALFAGARGWAPRILAFTSSTTARPTAGATPSEAPAVELLDLVERGGTRTYTARYKARASEPDLHSEQFTVEVWRDPPRVRQDTTSTYRGSTARTASLLVDGEATVCEQVDHEPWRCRPIADPAVDGPDSLAERLRDELPSRRVHSRSGRINGHDVRCFTLTGGGQPDVELCLDRDGVVVRLASEDLALELLAISARVNERVFDAPR